MRRLILIFAFTIFFNDGTSVTYDENYDFITPGTAFTRGKLVEVVDTRVKSFLNLGEIVSIYPMSNVKEIRRHHKRENS